MKEDTTSQSVLQKNYNIPVHVTDLSTFDESLSFMKARFHAEMSRVTDEMNKFSANITRLYQELTPKESQGGPRIRSASSRTPEVAAKPLENQNTPESLKIAEDVANNTSEKNRSKALPVQAAWAAISESPLLQQQGEFKKLRLQFDVSQFDPAEVRVQFLNDTIYVKAKHDERTDNSLVLREFNQQFMLPRGIDPETLVFSLSRDGVLTVEVPLPLPIIELVREGAKYKGPNIKAPRRKKDTEREPEATPAPATAPSPHNQEKENS